MNDATDANHDHKSGGGGGVFQARLQMCGISKPYFFMCASGGNEGDLVLQ